MILEKKELNEISAGGLFKWYVIGGVISFISGFISGFVNPKSCNK